MSCQLRCQRASWGCGSPIRITQQLESGIVAWCRRVTFDSLSGGRDARLIESTCGPAQLERPCNREQLVVGASFVREPHPKRCPGSESGDFPHLPWLNEANLSDILLLGTNLPRTGSCKSILGNNRSNFHALRLLTSSPTSVPASHSHNATLIADLYPPFKNLGGDFITCARVLNMTVKSTPSKQANAARRALVTTISPIS